MITDMSWEKVLDAEMQFKKRTHHALLVYMDHTFWGLVFSVDGISVQF